MSKEDRAEWWREPESFVPWDKRLPRKKEPKPAPLDEVNVEAYAAELQDRFG